MKNSYKIKRIYHKWDKWECYPAGFYETNAPGVKKEEGEKIYKDFLSDLDKFESALSRVMEEWKNSCEHYLTNEGMNRIAWLGQASLCIALGMPSNYRAGYFLMTKKQQKEADLLALKYLNKWLCKNGHEAVDLIGAGVKTKATEY